MSGLGGGSWEVGVGSWELGVGSWELGRRGDTLISFTLCPKVYSSSKEQLATYITHLEYWESSYL